MPNVLCNKTIRGFGGARTRTDACIEHATAKKDEVRYPLACFASQANPSCIVRATSISHQNRTCTVYFSNMARGEKAYLTAQSAYVIFENDLQEWLYVRRADTGYWDGAWGLPGGHVQPGEQIHEAAAREAFEEVGLRVDPNKLLLAYVLQRNKEDEGIEDRVDFYFKATEWSGQAENKEPHAHDAIGWHKPEAVPGEVMDFMGEAAVAITEGRRFGTFGWKK